jgi:hypothetical protein
MTRGLGRTIPNSTLIAANQHCQTLGTRPLGNASLNKTIDGLFPNRVSRLFKREMPEAAMPKDSQLD